ncbi:MAG: hypothetical protein ACKOZT_01255 [Cyanobium sp.]
MPPDLPRRDGASDRSPALRARRLPIRQRQPRRLALAASLSLLMLAPRLRAANAAPQSTLTPAQSPAVTKASGTTPAAPAAAPASKAPPAPFTTPELQALLRHGSLEELALGCERAQAEDRLDRLRMIRDRLLTLLPAPQPLPVILANAEVLLCCRQPEAALKVLDRLSPTPGAERVQWLLMQWRAANAALDHRRAAFAIERLTASRPERLDQLLLPVQRRDDGTVVSRPALDLLAEHQRARGFSRAAAELLLASRDTGVAGAQRRLEAVRALRQLPRDQREALLESALEQAAAAGAWGLVAELLDAQAALPSSRALERRLRLSPRIDDAYGEWLRRRQDPASAARTAELERQLRAPVSPTSAP